MGASQASAPDSQPASYWRVTFDHPPINTITAATVAELAELGLNRDGDLEHRLGERVVEAAPDAPR